MATCENMHSVDREHEAASTPGASTPGGRQRRVHVVAAAVLLVASTLLVASVDPPSSRRGADSLLSSTGGQQSLMLRAADRVNHMLTGSNPTMALEASAARISSLAARLPWGSAPSSGGLALPPSQGGPSGSILSASLTGERTQMRAQMLAKYNKVAEVSMPLLATTSKKVLAVAPRASFQQVQLPQRSLPVQMVQAQPAERKEAEMKQMKAMIATLEAKVQKLEIKKTKVVAPVVAAAPDTDTIVAAAPAKNTMTISPAKSSQTVAFTSPVVAKAAAQKRLVAKIRTAVGGSVAGRATAAVNNFIAGNGAGNAGATQNRASAMVNGLIAGRLAQKTVHVVHDSPHQLSHPLPTAAAPASKPALATPAQYQYQQQKQNEYQKQQYPQAVPVEYPSFPTEAPAASTMANLAAMISAPAPSVNTIYYPGEQQHIRAEDAMTPEALAQPNLPSNLVQQYPQQMKQDMYDPTPLARPALPDPMPTGYGAASSSGVQDHLFDMFASKKNAEEYLGGAGAGNGADGSLMAPTGVAMASAGGGNGGDDSGGDPFDDAMFNVIHDCSLGGPGC